MSIMLPFNSKKSPLFCTETAADLIKSANIVKGPTPTKRKEKTDPTDFCTKKKKEGENAVNSGSKAKSTAQPLTYQGLNSLLLARKAQKDSPSSQGESQPSPNADVRAKIFVTNPQFPTYPSTVVTMTNNMATIRKHTDNGQGELIKIIDNVINSEKQITRVFASVSQSCGAQVTTVQELTPTSIIGGNEDLLNILNAGKGPQM